MFASAIGLSDNIAVPKLAIDEAIQECRAELRKFGLDDSVKAGFLWTAKMDLNHLDFILKQVKNAFPHIVLVGCTTDGEIGPRDFIEDSLSLVVFAENEGKVKFWNGFGLGLSLNPQKAANEAFLMIDEKAGDYKISKNDLCLAFPNGLAAFSQDVVYALQSVFPCPIFGATSGDGYEFEKPYEFFIDDKVCDVFHDSAPVMVISGESVVFANSVGCGWKPVERKQEYIVTEANGSRVNEINYEPALEFYKNYFGELSKEPEVNDDINSLYSSFPIAVFENDANKEHYDYLRTPTGFNSREGYVNFAGTVPVGAKILLTTVNRSDIVADAKKFIKRARSKLDCRKVVVTLIFSCCSRQRILGSKAKEEFEYLKQQKIDNYVGFYGYGEIAPVNGSLDSKFLSSSFITLLIGV